jgi:hypothetical protein
MRRRTLGLALVAAMTLCGCASGGRVRLPLPAPDGAVAGAKACADWRWIGIRSGSAQACPAVAGWAVKPLFSPGPASKREREEYAQQRRPEPEPVGGGISTAAVLDELQRFCVYEPAGEHSARDLPFPPAASHHLVRFDQDCAALSIAGDPLPPAVWKPAAEQFLAQAGKPAAPLAIHGQRGVRLAFLDTQPTGVGVPRAPGYSQHGYAMAHIARNLVCGPAASDRCAALITTRLALPLASFDATSRARTVADTTRGGHVGMQSDLAGAITGEVDDWLAARSVEGAPQRLVLNLSLAWDPRIFGGLDEAQIAELRAGTQAVYRALQYAASLDVLVLAAAGNQKKCAGVPAEGPLLPAAWEASAPPEDACDAPRPAPLVYAVGGLGTDGGPLWNARPGGMPRRAAYGEHAVVPTWDADRPTAMYTGSSVATAVASSAAAMVWDVLPALRAREVMDLLDADTYGTVLSLRADFWHDAGAAAAPGTAPRVHRLSLCEALQEACSRPGATGCPLSSACEAPPEPVVLSGIAADHTIAGTCQPWLYPQPEDPPCPNCIKEPPP